MNDPTMPDRLSFSGMPSAIHSTSSLNMYQQQMDASSYKSLAKPQSAYSTQDFKIVKEVIQQAYHSHPQDLRYNQSAKLDQVRLIEAYENVLNKYGIDPMSDGYFYRLLLKIESSKEDLFKALESEMQRNADTQIALIHYDKCLKAKSFFALVSHMVNHKLLLSARSAQSQKSKRSQKSCDKENVNTVTNKRKKSSGKVSKQQPLKEQSMRQQMTQRELQGYQRVDSAASLPKNVFLGNQGRQSITSQHSHKNSNLINVDLINKQMRPHHVHTNTNYTGDTADGSSVTGTTNFKFERTQSSSGLQQALFKSESMSGTLNFGHRRQESGVTDYKLKLKYLKQWIKYVKRVKKERQDEDQALQNWAVSIHYHDQTLLNKALFSLSKFRDQNRNFKKNARVVKVVHEMKLRRNYFCNWLRAHRESAKNKEHMFKALNHWGSSLSTKVLHSWRQQVIKSKHQSYTTFEKYMDKPQTILTLLIINNHHKWKTFKDLEQKLSNSLYHQEMLPYLLNSIKQYYLQTVFSALKPKSSINNQVQNFHQRYILKSLQKLCKKRQATKINYSKLKNENQLKLKWQFFAIWINTTTDLIISKNQQDKAAHYYERTLKYKVLRSVLSHMHQRQFVTSQMSKSVNTNMSKLIQKSFQGWKFVAVYNREQRKQLRKGRVLHLQSLKTQYFMRWLNTAILVCKARLHCEKQTMKRGWKGFQQMLDRVENKAIKIYDSKQHYQSHLLRTVIKQWTKHALESKNERHLRRTVFKYMQTYKQKQVLVAWKESANQQKYANEIKSLSTLNYNTKLQKIAITSLFVFRQYSKNNRLNQVELEQTTETKMKMRAFKEWIGKFKKRKTLQRNFSKTVDLEKARNVTRHFLGWFELAQRKKLQRVNFFKGRAHYLMNLAFKNWRLYSTDRTSFRQQLHAFLRLRAVNLQTTAMRALYGYTKAHEVQRKLNKVAAFLFLERNLQKCFKALKKQLQLKQAGVKFTQLKKKSLKNRCMRLWKQRYIRKDIVKRFREQKQTQTKFKCLQLWQTFIVQQRFSQQKIHLGLQNYGQRLSKITFKALKAHQEKRRNSKLSDMQAYSIYLQRLVRIGFLHIYHFNALKKQRKQLVDALKQKHALSLKFKVMNGLLGYLKSKKYYGSKLSTLTNNKKRRVQRRCLSNLYAFALKKSCLRRNYSQLQDQRLKQRKSKVFLTLKQLAFQHKQKHHLAEKATSFYRVHTLRKGIYSFVRNKVINDYTKELYKRRDQLLIKKHLQQWHNLYREALEDKPYFQVADTYRKRKAFDLFNQKRSLSSIQSMTQQHFKKKALLHFETHQKVRGIKQLFRYSQLFKLRRMKQELADKIICRRVFGRWKYNLQQLHNSKVRKQLSQTFRQQQLLIKGMRTFLLYIHLVKSQILKVQVCEERQKLVTKKRLLELLSNHAKKSKDLKSRAMDKLRFIGKKNLKPWFDLWSSFISDHKQQQKAARFRVKRGAQYLLRIAVDRWRVGVLIEKESQIKKLMADTFYKRKLQCSTFTEFRFLIQKIGNVRLIQKQTNLIREHKIQTLAFNALRTNTDKGIANKTLKYKAQEFLAINLLKKSLLALQKNQCVNEISKVIRARQSLNTLQTVISHWKMQYMRSVALTQTFNILESVRRERLTKQFYQRLVKLSFYQQIYENLQSKRNHKYANTFIQLLKRNLIYGQIVRGFQFAKKQHLKRLAFIGLLQNRQHKHNHRTIVESHINIAMEENNNDLVRSVFNSLKQHVISQKFKIIAKHSYSLRLMKKGLAALCIGGMKLKLENSATRQVQIMQTSRFFWYWLNALQKKRQELEVQVVMENRLVQNVVQAWRQWCQQQRNVKLFRIYKDNQNLKPVAFNALVLHYQRKKYLRHCEQEIASNRKFQLQKEVMLNWMDYNNLQRISLNMKQFHSFKFQKTVVDGWREVTQRNNSRRLNLIHIRQQLQANPSLIKPLLVIRNVCVYKAFRALIEGTQQSAVDTKNNDTSKYAFYLRLIRKTFFALKMNVHSRYQRKKIQQLQDLFIQRRWLRNLQQASEESKRDRKLRTDSAIFNFLNLQRKGFQALMECASKRQQQRIKNQFAEELYYKRLADKVILALRMNKEEGKKIRIITSPKANVTIYNEISLGMSRYEYDLSNLQLECSAVLDIKEKTKLVRELYCKKLMFKCFAGWANMAMSLSEDESYIQQNDIAHVSFSNKQQFLK